MPKRKSPAVRMDTRVAIYSPPDGTDVANLDAVGGLDLSVGNWTLEGYDWAETVIQSSADRAIGNQAGVLQSIELKMWRRSDVVEGWRLKVLNGPWQDRYFAIESIGFEDARPRTMSLICRLSS